MKYKGLFAPIKGSLLYTNYNAQTLLGLHRLMKPDFMLIQTDPKISSAVALMSRQTSEDCREKPERSPILCKLSATCLVQNLWFHS